MAFWDTLNSKGLCRRRRRRTFKTLDVGNDGNYTTFMMTLLDNFILLAVYVPYLVQLCRSYEIFRWINSLAARTDLGPRQYLSPVEGLSCATREHVGARLF